MSDLIKQSPPVGTIVAQNISAEEYLAHYAETHHEWVEGFVIKMSPESLRHDLLISYFRKLFEAYLELNPIGQVVDQPFVMKLADSYREPDLQFIHRNHIDRLKDTMVEGAADICIEIVSPESHTRDYGEKLAQYEAGGVAEYWLIDPARRNAVFYRLQADGHYTVIQLDAQNNYQTPLLPKFKFPVLTLWQETLPRYSEVWTMVTTMFKD